MQQYVVVLFAWLGAVAGLRVLGESITVALAGGMYTTFCCWLFSRTEQ